PVPRAAPRPRAPPEAKKSHPPGAVPADGQGATAAPRLLLRRLRALRRAGTGLAAAPGRHDVDAAVRVVAARPGRDPPGAAWGRAALQWRPPGADRGGPCASVCA